MTDDVVGVERSGDKPSLVYVIAVGDIIDLAGRARQRHVSALSRHSFVCVKDIIVEFAPGLNHGER